MLEIRAKLKSIRKEKKLLKNMLHRGWVYHCAHILKLKVAKHN